MNRRYRYMGNFSRKSNALALLHAYACWCGCHGFVIFLFLFMIWYANYCSFSDWKLICTSMYVRLIPGYSGQTNLIIASLIRAKFRTNSDMRAWEPEFIIKSLVRRPPPAFRPWWTISYLRTYVWFACSPASFITLLGL